MGAAPKNKMLDSDLTNMLVDKKDSQYVINKLQ